MVAFDRGRPRRRRNPPSGRGPTNQKHRQVPCRPSHFSTNIPACNRVVCVFFFCLQNPSAMSQLWMNKFNCTCWLGFGFCGCDVLFVCCVFLRRILLVRNHISSYALYVSLFSLVLFCHLFASWRLFGRRQEGNEPAHALALSGSLLVLLLPSSSSSFSFAPTHPTTPHPPPLPLWLSFGFPLNTIDHLVVFL